MKANELMIGDWVQHQEGPCKVVAIAQNGIYFKDDKGEGVVTLDHLEPIILTAEILEKNGWRPLMNGSGDYILTTPLVGNSATVTKTINGFELRNGAFNDLGILFVHELQHALKLCGIEKDIEL